jgi:hypothetical protein
MSAKVYYYSPRTKVPKDKMYWEYYVRHNPVVFTLFLRLNNVVTPLYTLDNTGKGFRHIKIYL